MEPNRSMKHKINLVWPHKHIKFYLKLTATLIATEVLLQNYITTVRHKNLISMIKNHCSFSTVTVHIRN